jgi:hypothetical protein
MAVEFSRKGDAIVMKRGRAEPIEMFPASPTELFQKGTFVRVVFEKDAAGNVARATVSDWGNAQELTRADAAPPRQ